MTEGSDCSQTNLEPRQVVLYCDGACRGNPGLGAYAAIITCDGHEREMSAVVDKTTNNRMELMAAITALESLTEACRVTVVTDSQYLCRGMTEWIAGWQLKGWQNSKRKPVLNQDLWQRLLALAKKHEIEWRWVRGHDGHVFNERCDRLANQAMDEYLRQP